MDSRWLQVKSADLIVLLNLREDLLSLESVLLVYHLSTVFEAEPLSLEVRRGKHPSKDDQHAQYHNFGLAALILFRLVLGDEEEDDKHVSVSEEHIEPLLIPLEGEILYLQVVVLFDQ